MASIVNQLPATDGTLQHVRPDRIVTEQPRRACRRKTTAHHADHPAPPRRQMRHLFQQLLSGPRRNACNIDVSGKNNWPPPYQDRSSSFPGLPGVAGSASNSHRPILIGKAPLPQPSHSETCCGSSPSCSSCQSLITQTHNRAETVDLYFSVGYADEVRKTMGANPQHPRRPSPTFWAFQRRAAH